MKRTSLRAWPALIALPLTAAAIPVTTAAALPTPGALLGLDPGEKRIGVAVSDELGMLAHPLDFLPAEPVPEFLNGLKKLLQEREVSLILVGLPRNMDGSYGPAVRKVEECVILLKETIPIPVRTWDERLTTKDAEELLIAADVGWKKRKGLVDRIAAAILLQSYLEAQSPPPVQAHPAETEAGVEQDNRHQETAGRPYEAARDSHRARPRRRTRRGGRVSDDEMG